MKFNLFLVASHSLIIVSIMSFVFLDINPPNLESFRYLVSECTEGLYIL